MLRRLGVSQEIIDAMERSDGEAGLLPDESAALAFAGAMTLDARNVPNTVWQELREHFDEGQIIEIAAVTALFNGFNRFNDALEVEVTR